MLENVQLTLNMTPEDAFPQPSSQMESAGMDILGWPGGQGSSTDLSELPTNPTPHSQPRWWQSSCRPWAGTDGAAWVMSILWAWGNSLKRPSTSLRRLAPQSKLQRKGTGAGEGVLKRCHTGLLAFRARSHVSSLEGLLHLDLIPNMGKCDFS